MTIPRSAPTRSAIGYQCSIVPASNLSVVPPEIAYVPVVTWVTNERCRVGIILCPVIPKVGSRVPTLHTFAGTSATPPAHQRGKQAQQLQKRLSRATDHRRRSSNESRSDVNHFARPTKTTCLGRPTTTTTNISLRFASPSTHNRSDQKSTAPSSASFGHTQLNKHAHDDQAASPTPLDP